MRIAHHLYEQIVNHALENPRIECCGLVASLNNEAVSVHRCVNTEEGRYGKWGAKAAFTLDPQEQLEYMEQFERDGLELGAIYHSHPGMSAVPSPIDTMYGRNFPGVQWIIVGLRHQGPAERPFFRASPDVWNWYIDEDERIYTAELEVIKAEIAV